MLLTPQRSHEYHSRCRRQHGLWKAYWVDDGGSQASATATYDYDAAGCLTNLNGTSLEWDERYRLKEVQIANSTNLAKSVSYEYDVLGRRVSRLEDSVTNFFVYDGQQIVADLDGNGDILRSYVWGPGIDNLLSVTVYPNGGSQASATATYAYDAAGCLTNLNGTSLEWDERYRLKEVQIANGTNLAKSVSYEYDVLGRRVSRLEDGVTNFFVHDGNLLYSSVLGENIVERVRLSHGRF